jgi:ribonucleotide reductase beta subunit family protein with ferritin-like domain
MMNETHKTLWKVGKRRGKNENILNGVNLSKVHCTKYEIITMKWPHIINVYWFKNEIFLKTDNEVYYFLSHGEKSVSFSKGMCHTVLLLA